MCTIHQYSYDANMRSGSKCKLLLMWHFILRYLHSAQLLTSDEGDILPSHWTVKR